MRTKKMRNYRVRKPCVQGGFGSGGRTTMQEVIEEHAEGEQPEGAVLVEDEPEKAGGTD